MSSPRTLLISLALCIGVAIVWQGLVRLVANSGATDQPAVILQVLLAAFLGLLTAVAARSMRLGPALAPAILVLAWIVMPPIFGALPWAFFDNFGGTADLSAAEALSLAVATTAAAITQAVTASVQG